MKYLIELSKEHKTLPKAEVLTCLNAEKINFDVLESKDDILIIELRNKDEQIKRLAERLSFTFFINEFLFSCTPENEEIKKNAQKNIIKQKGSIAVKYKNRSKNIDSKNIVEPLADIYTTNRHVVLENPDIEIRSLITDSKTYIGIKKFEINRTIFEKRKVQHRPFFSPITMHPKLARCLVNISCIKRNEILLDPFCGTGGILLEAGLIGAKVVGSDIEEKMVKGSRKTLDFYNIKNYDLFNSDIGDIHKNIKKVDSVVTDLPYGKSTTTKGEEMNKLYQRSFQQISKILKKRGKAVIGLSRKEMISIGENYLSLLEIHEFRVHRSLTRFFAVYQK